MIRLLHIAPELPPTVGGVADYTTILSRRLVEVSDGSIEPVLLHAGKTLAEAIEVDFPVVDISGRQSAATLADTVRERANEVNGHAVILLEYVGYGYAKRGAPLWVMRGLSRVCGRKGLSLVTMFHEISASGPIWTSAFWLSPVQSWVARRIARLSEGMMTTHPTGAGTLGQWTEDTPVTVSPAFSNVGEPDVRPPFEERPPRAVIFGGARTKTALYDTHRAATQACLERWGIREVVDIGPPGAATPDAFFIPVDQRGIQPANAISDALLDARIGLLQYPAAYATKSGVLAAYMAHGVVPVLVDAAPLDGGRLEAGTHFATAEHERASVTPEVAQTAADWYDHNAHSRRAARSTLDLIEQATMPGPSTHSNSL